ncbi:MAG: hypothetical protein ACSNEK_05475 [Parachlamydiaceae bacterium]
MTYSQLARFKQGQPHDQYSIKGSKQGKRVCRVLFIRKLFLSPFTAPTSSIYSMILAAIKIGELGFRFIMLTYPTPKNSRKFVRVSKQISDYLMLSVILPARVLADIGRLAVAMVVHSHYYFSKLDKHPLTVQMKYYDAAIYQELQKFWFATHLTLQQKAEINELKDAYKRILGELGKAERKKIFSEKFLFYLRLMDPMNLHSQYLIQLRKICLDFALKENIQVEFKIAYSASNSRNSSFI